MELMFRKGLSAALTGGVLAAALGSNASIAAINASTSGPGISAPTNTEDFESYSGATGQPLAAASGITFDCATCNFYISNYGGTNTLYQNGGSTSMTTISLTSGDDIDAISMMNYNGFGDTESQIWVRAYNNGSPVASFQLPLVPIGSTITVWSDNGSVFDEVRIQAYRDTDSINEDESQYGAIAIDNVIIGAADAPGPVTPPQPIPVMPFSGLGVMVLGLLAVARRMIARR